MSRNPDSTQSLLREETGHLLGLLRMEMPMIIGRLNQFIERNKDYWQPPTDERKQYVDSIAFRLEDLRTDQDITEALNDTITSVQTEVKRIGAYRVDQISVLTTDSKERFGIICFFRIHCSV